MLARMLTLVVGALALLCAQARADEPGATGDLESTELSQDGRALLGGNRVYCITNYTCKRKLGDCYKCVNHYCQEDPECCKSDDDCEDCYECDTYKHHCKPKDGCCKSDGDCDDCYECDEYKHVCKPKDGCCKSDDECEDCYECDEYKHVCKPKDGCCKSDDECEDCYECDTYKHVCKPKDGCCKSDGDCDDCYECDVYEHKCKPKDGCCKTHRDCDDGVDCTKDKCRHGHCKHIPKRHRCKNVYPYNPCKRVYCDKHEGCKETPKRDGRKCKVHTPYGKKKGRCDDGECKYH